MLHGWAEEGKGLVCQDHLLCLGCWAQQQSLPPLRSRAGILLKQAGNPELSVGHLLEVPWVASVSSRIGSPVLLDTVHSPGWLHLVQRSCRLGCHGPAPSVQINYLRCKVGKTKPSPWYCWDFPSWKLKVLCGKGKIDCPRPVRPVLFTDERVSHLFIDETLLGFLLRDWETINE